MIIIADWAADSLSCQEVKTAIEGFLKDPTYPNISFVATSSSTIQTGYVLAQLVYDEERFGRSLETVIYQNTDPRIQSADSGEPQEAKFIIIKLTSGMYLCGPNAGYNFSFIKKQIDKVFTYSIPDHGEQFRSRDLYPRIGAHLMDAMEEDLELEEIAADTIPSLQGYYIGHIDNFSNIKTTITLEDLKGKYEFKNMVNVKIGDVEKTATFVDRLFGYKSGELVIYPGSSGPQNNPYLEIAIWRDFTLVVHSSGAQEFNNPLPGTEIKLR